ncbi:MAG: DUF1122 family protein [Acidobacteriota bacterium]
MEPQSRNKNNPHPHPLQSLEGKELGAYKLHLAQLKQLRLSGWRGFTLHLQSKEGKLSASPIVRGIFSSGGKDGVKSWMDINYFEEAVFNDEQPSDKINLSEQGLDRRLFQYLAGLIEPGGHMMVSYEDENRIHINTLASLAIGIPPAVTPLGELLWWSGFQLVKDWYLAEGGHEGPRKLWAEKAPDTHWADEWNHLLIGQLSEFLSRKPRPDYISLEQSARERARTILDKLSA